MFFNCDGGRFYKEFGPKRKEGEVGRGKKNELFQGQ